MNLPLVSALVLLMAWAIPAAADDDDDHRDEYRGGSLRLGAFAIENIEANVRFGPEDLPLLALVDIREDLGIRDSVVASRLNFQYRFSRHHAMSVGYYRLDLDGIVRLSRTIEIGDSQFDIGIDVQSHYEEQITKLAYNWIFHDEGKVLLSVTPGVHFSKARLSMQALGTGIGGQIGVDESEDASITAPLPMLGGRIVYRINDKWSIIALSDIFFLTHDSQEGQLTDFHVFAEYRTSERFSVGGGLNRFTLDLKLIDDGVRWDWSSVYTGAYLYMAIHF